MALTLVRHPRPLASGFCYGQSEVEVAVDLTVEVEALVGRVGRLDRVVTSPLGRCRRFAELVGDRLGVPVSIDAGWQEIDFGRWEGRPWDEVPRAELDAWAADFLNARPHGGESVAMLLARTRRVLAACRALPGNTLVVTHAGPIRAALFDAGGGAGAWRREIGFGEVVRLAPALSTGP